MIQKNMKAKFQKFIISLSLSISSLVILVSGFVFLPNTAFGTDCTSTDLSTCIHIDNPIKGNGDLETFIKNILDGIVLILTPVLVIMVVYCGYLFVSAQGNTEKLGEAKKALMYTLIGAAIVLGAKGLETIIGNTVGALAP